LKEKGNVPMTGSEIYNHIEQNFDLKTSGKTPESSVNTYLLAYSDNSTVKRKRKKNLFHIVENKPKNKYILLDSNISIDKKTFQDLEKEVEIETEVDVTQDQKVKRLSANSEERVENPFRQSICVLGDPGVGKSATTIEALNNDPNHSFYLNIPTDLSSSMLAKFVKGELVLNRISEMIIKAYQNPKKKYTILIDEFHKPLTLRRV
jgi:DNA replication protein DnaC